jgi:pimeloyl-ACP methyl ester carboxylesterase
MPHVSVNGCEYFVRDQGSGPETIVFGHGYLMTHRLFDEQVAALKDDYRCIAFDWRGQGMSEITTGGYDVRDLARDVDALLDALDIEKCHYVGLSMGGFVGFRLLAHYGDRLHSAILLDSDAGAESRWRWMKYQAMIAMVERFGYDSVMDRVIPLMFGETFRREHPDEVERWTERITAQDPRGICAAGRGIFSRESVLPLLGQARTPTLLIVGGEDVTTPPEKTATAHDALPNSRMLIIPHAGHSSAVEQPDTVTNAIRTFITEDVQVTV